MKTTGKLKRSGHGRQEKKRTESRQERKAKKQRTGEKRKNAEGSEQGLRQPALGSRGKA